MQTMASLAPYLFQLLYQHGVSHAFGIPGDFALTLYDALQESPIQPVVVTHEPSAGFAADVYARIRGLGLAVITYSVGGINLANAVAGAYAEKSPLVVISGGPGVKERKERQGLHHKIKTYDTQYNIFREITAYAAIMDDPKQAADQIHHALNVCLTQKRPVYLEIPRDQIYADIGNPIPVKSPVTIPDPEALQEALNESISMLTQAKRPVILVDIEIQRHGLQPQVIALAERLQAPVCSTLLGKSAFPESHPAFAGVYSGSVGDPNMRELVETSDGLLMLGVLPTDINLGLFTAKFNPHATIDASSDRVQIKYHTYPSVHLTEYVHALSAHPFDGKKYAFARPIPIDSAQQTQISMRGVIDGLNHFLNDNMMLIGDAGDALFTMADISSHKNTLVIHPSFYSSMGFGVPGAIGAALADSNKRAVVLVGDGAFQMTGWELITAKKLGLRPIVIVLNNGTFGSLQSMGHTGAPFVRIASLDYKRIAETLGGTGFRIQTTAEFASALDNALNQSHFCILDVCLDKMDASPMLQRLGKLFASTLKG